MNFSHKLQIGSYLALQSDASSWVFVYSIIDSDTEPSDDSMYDSINFSQRHMTDWCVILRTSSWNTPLSFSEWDWEFLAAACNFCKTQLSHFRRVFLAFLGEAITHSAQLSFSSEFLALHKASFVCVHSLSLAFSAHVSLWHVLCSKCLHSNTWTHAIWRAEFDGPELPEWELLPSEKPPEEEILFTLLPVLILAIDRQAWALGALEWAIQQHHVHVLSSRHVCIAFFGCKMRSFREYRIMAGTIIFKLFWHCKMSKYMVGNKFFLAEFLISSILGHFHTGCKPLGLKMKIPHKRTY